MTRVRVKICGVRTAAEARAAAQAGADAVGLVFYDASPRAITLAAAREINRALPPFITRVALFLDSDEAELWRVIDAVRPDVLQFHGRETPAFCRRFGLPYIKAVPMGDGYIDLDDWARAYDDAQALLLDAHSAGEAGGRGKRFQWQGHSGLSTMPIVIAGGLDADNVADAIGRFAPYAVDVSSGVEITPGEKDVARMHEFVTAVLTTG